MINRSRLGWELARTFMIIFIIYFLYVALNEIFHLAVSVFSPQSIEGGVGLVFSFTGFLSRLFTLFAFLFAVLIGEKIIFKQKLMAIESYSMPIIRTDRRGLKKTGNDILYGLMLGTSLFTLLFLVFKGIGWLTVTGFLFSAPAVTPPGVYLQILWSVPVLFISAVFEELLTRGFLLSVCKKTCGTAGGIFLSALSFSLMHFYNPYFSTAGLIGIFLAGLWFGLAYVLTGALYLSTAAHFSWNISQMLLGFPVSGLEDRKSTRLNSSHVRISYAVFCLKKKKKYKF